MSTPEIARDVGKRAVVVGSMASKLNGKIEEQRWNITEGPFVNLGLASFS
jgi:hypothetical protein